MKKILFLLLAVAMVACNNNQSYTIKIQMSELADLQMELRQNVDGEMITIDSLTLDSEGMGEISGSIDSPEMLYIGEKGQRRALSVFLDNYNYTVSGTFEDVSVEADGGVQVEYNEYKEGAKAIEEKQQAIVEKYYEAQAAQVSQDSLAKLLEPYYALGEEKSANDSIYMADNPSSVVSIYILRGVYYQMGAEELEAKLAVFDESIQMTSYYTFMAKHLEKMQKVAVGQKFVDFELPDVDGNPVKLSDLAGKGVLLIDFWASWCGPCRKANPGVVEIYNEYHDKGFDILGVSLDRTKEDWLQGISEDGLVWNQVSDIKFWQCEAAQLYAVSSIPHTVLLDKDGTIVARPQNEEELRAKVQELLGE
jgi:peroxiredoxin